MRFFRFDTRWLYPRDTFEIISVTAATLSVSFPVLHGLSVYFPVVDRDCPSIFQSCPVLSVSFPVASKVAPCVSVKNPVANETDSKNGRLWDQSNKMELHVFSYEELLATVREKAVEFDAHLCRAKKANDELVCKSEKAINTLKELMGTVRVKPTKTCTVCYTRDLSTCLVPCGHIFCDNCAARARQRNPAKCFTCRQRIDDSLKVYV